jgi:hypothetical protein
MNQFTVDREEPAQDELARLWLTSADPAAITQATARVDQRLARDPFGQGQHVAEGLYHLDEPPLRVAYQIDEDARIVLVVGVWERS